jgi:Fur family ferric uptake transcriptional regulator
MSIKNIKLTTARKAIFTLLENANKPLCYDEIKEQLTMDKATFYRNITKFEEEQIVSCFEANDRRRYYEIQKKPHAHFICNQCNTIECINAPFSINLPDYIIHNVILKGICKTCAP